MVCCEWIDFHIKFASEVSKIGRGVILLFKLDYTSRRVLGNESSASFVDLLYSLGCNRNQNVGSFYLLRALYEVEAGVRELAKTGNEVDMLGDAVTNPKRSKLLYDLSSRSVFVNLKLGLEEFGGNFNSSNTFDVVTSVGNLLRSMFDQVAHNLLLDFVGWSNQVGNLFNGHEVTVVLAIWVGHIPENFFEFIEVMLFKGDNKVKLVVWVGVTLQSPVGGDVFQSSGTKDLRLSSCNEN